MVAYDFSVIKGDTYLGASFQILRDSIPVDLTGVSIRACFRTNVNFPIALEMNTENGKITIDTPLEGRFSFVEQLIDIVPNIYLYDIQLTFPDNKVATLIGGSMTVIQDVTF